MKSLIAVVFVLALAVGLIPSRALAAGAASDLDEQVSGNEDAILYLPAAGAGVLVFDEDSKDRAIDAEVE